MEHFNQVSSLNVLLSLYSWKRFADLCRLINQQDDIRFFAGCCLWEPGQLEREIERGIWIPCRGPPEIVLTGECTHRAAPDASSSGKYGNGPCLWLSMLSACGQDEASLAHLFVDNPED